MSKSLDCILRNASVPQLYFRSKVFANGVVQLVLEFNGCQKPESVWCYYKGTLELSEIHQTMEYMVKRFFSKHGLYYPDAG